jgi:hypothetical protein
MRRFFSRIVIAAFFSSLAHAEVTRIEITERASFAGGKTFGSTGAYESIKGRMFLETDP